jgi:ribosomal protein L37AE/L43A
MELLEQMSMTREQRLGELGSEPPCPQCGKPRVSRSSYIRCNPCGMNWGEGQDIFKHPHMKAIPSTGPAIDTTAPTAK